MKGMILQGSTIFLSNREARCESFAMQPSVFPANWGEQAIISLEGRGGCPVCSVLEYPSLPGPGDCDADRLWPTHPDIQMGILRLPTCIWFWSMIPCLLRAQSAPQPAWHPCDILWFMRASCFNPFQRLICGFTAHTPIPKCPKVRFTNSTPLKLNLIPGSPCISHLKANLARLRRKIAFIQTVW